MARTSDVPQSIDAIYDISQMNTRGDEARACTLASRANDATAGPQLAAARAFCRRRRPRRPALRDWGSGGTAEGEDEGHDRESGGVGGGVTNPNVLRLGLW